MADGARPGGAATSIVLMIRGMGGAMFNVACSAAFTFGTSLPLPHCSSLWINVVIMNR
jgi:hypothetical protein